MRLINGASDEKVADERMRHLGIAESQHLCPGKPFASCGGHTWHMGPFICTVFQLQWQQAAQVLYFSVGAQYGLLLLLLLPLLLVVVEVVLLLVL